MPRHDDGFDGKLVVYRVGDELTGKNRGPVTLGGQIVCSQGRPGLDRHIEAEGSFLIKF